MSEEPTVQTGPPLPAESGDVNYAFAALAGVAAAAVGAGLWYGFVVITDIIFGGVAIAMQELGEGHLRAVEAIADYEHAVGREIGRAHV